MKFGLAVFRFRAVRRNAAVVLALGLAVAASIVHAADLTYVVKKGDTLSAIARRYGLSTAQLAERNGITRNGYVYVGQRLKVPGPSTPTPAPTTDGLPATIQSAISRAPVKTGRWKYIVIHHSGVDTGTVKGMDQYHREIRHMENGLAYHFVIGNGSGMGDGQIAVGPRWPKQLPGGHLASEAQNQIAIGICLVGNFDRHGPSAKQLKSLRALVQALMKRCQLGPKSVKTHQQINVVGTRCPGSRFPTRSFLRSLEN